MILKIKIKIPTIPNYTASIYADHSDSIWFSILFFKSTNQMMSERKLKTLCERASVGKSRDVLKILVGTVVVILTSILSLTMLIDEAIWLRNFTDLKQKSNKFESFGKTTSATTCCYQHNLHQKQKQKQQQPSSMHSSISILKFIQENEQLWLKQLMNKIWQRICEVKCFSNWTK